MARLSDLVQAVAAATRVEPTSISVIARSLREAGHITTGGRGLNAARMTSRDLASLLLAVCSPGDNTKAGHTVTSLGRLSLDTTGRTPAGPHLTEQFQRELGISAELSLHDCLSMQIDRYPCGLTVEGNGQNYRATIQLGLAAGNMIDLHFCQGEQLSYQSADTNDGPRPGKTWRIELPPAVIHQAALGLKDRAPAP